MTFSGKNKGGRPRTMRLRPPATTVPESVPAVDSAQSLPLALSPELPVSPTTFQKLPDDSKVRAKVMTILAMRVAGIEDEQIAKELHIGAGTLRNYIYLAGRNGWLTAESIANPVETIEYTLLHKVVRNLDRSLDSDDKDERGRVTEKLFDATMAKHWAPVAAGPQQTLVAIRIEHPQGPPQQVREGTVQGLSAWTDGEES